MQLVKSRTNTPISVGGRGPTDGRSDPLNILYRMPRPERDVIKDPAVLSKRDLAIGATVQVIKHRFGQSAPRQGPEIMHTDNPRGCHLA